MTQAKRIYDPRIFEGRVMLPEEQEQLYELLLKSERFEFVSNSMRELIEDEWPELAHKLPPKKRSHEVVSDPIRELIEDEFPELAHKLPPKKRSHEVVSDPIRDLIEDEFPDLAHKLPKPWSDTDLRMLQDSLDYGDTFAQAASFLCRDEDEVRQKARALGLVEHPGNSIRSLKI
jgi:uncharacterized membrane-anchored protein YjiN (DUF445 family)